MVASDKALFSSPKRRVLAVTLMTFLTAVIMTAGMPLYLPFSQTDNIGIPILLFPLTWTGFFLFSALCERMWKVWSVLCVVLITHALLIFFSLM